MAVFGSRVQSRPQFRENALQIAANEGIHEPPRIDTELLVLAELPASVTPSLVVHLAIELAQAAVRL